MRFRYSAVGAGDAVLRGFVDAVDPARAREALRDRGLRVLRLEARAGRRGWAPPWAEMLRRRRTAARADILHEIASLLESGVPLGDALEVAAGGSILGASRRRMLADLSRAVRAGAPLSEAIRSHPGWFDAADIAVLAAGEHAGTMAAACVSLSARDGRADELSRRIATILAYPLCLSVLTIAVVAFLGRVTLPGLAGVLREAGVPVPWLTSALIWSGRALAVGWPGLVVLLAVVAMAPAAWARIAAHRGGELPARVRCLVPAAARKAVLAGVLRELALMLRCGVPLVEALRIAAPTARGPLSPGLHRRLHRAASSIEAGDTLAAGLDDPLWFPPSVRRAVEVGESTGELADQLERIARTEAERARALADRLAALLQPAAVIVLAIAVGTVIMAVVQPLARMQEILR